MKAPDIRHLVSEARFTDDGSYVECDCGEAFTGATPEVSRDDHQAHRRSLGLKITGGQRSDGTAYAPLRKGWSL